MAGDLWMLRVRLFATSAWWVVRFGIVLVGLDGGWK